MHRSAAVLTLALGTLAACAGANRVRAYVAPTEETVTLVTEEAQGDVPAQIVHVANQSTVPILVYSVTLRGCENVKQRCEPRPLRLQVHPGSRALLQRVEPRVTTAAYKYAISYAWRADSAGTVALSQLAQQGDTAASARLEAQTIAVAERRAQVGAVEEELDAEDMKAAAPKVAAVKVVPDSVVLRPGQMMLVHQLRVLLMGADREPLGRVRAYRWRVRGPAVGHVAGDTVLAVAPGRGAVEITMIDSLLPGRANALGSVRVPIVVARQPE